MLLPPFSRLGKLLWEYSTYQAIDKQKREAQASLFDVMGFWTKSLLLMLPSYRAGTQYASRVQQ